MRWQNCHLKGGIHQPIGLVEANPTYVRGVGFGPSKAEPVTAGRGLQELQLQLSARFVVGSQLRIPHRKAPAIGVLAREATEGSLMEKWAECLQGLGAAMVDVLNGFLEIFTVKDEVGQECNTLGLECLGVAGSRYLLWSGVDGVGGCGSELDVHGGLLNSGDLGCFMSRLQRPKVCIPIVASPC